MKIGFAKAFYLIPSIFPFLTTTCRYRKNGKRINRKEVIDWWRKHRRAPKGRNSCIAQGASPGLIVSIHFLSPVGAALIIHEEKTRFAFPKLKTSAKSVQTTAEVCADYTCSLYRLQLKSPESTMYLRIYLRVLTGISTRTYLSICVYLLQRVRCTHFGKCAHLHKPFS